MSFFDVISKVDTDSFIKLVESKTDSDIEKALSKNSPLDLDDFSALISENARKHYLDVMVRKSMQLTR